MNVQNKSIYEFGSFRLDPAQHILLRDGQLVSLTPKVFETLRILVESGGQVVEKDELLNKIWSDTIVEEASLAKNISVLRKVLSENGSGESGIETIPKRGYRFTTPIKECEAKPADSIPELKKTPKRKVFLAVIVLVLLSSLGFAGYKWSVGKPSETKHEDIKSVAILPFKPLNSSEEDEVLGLGMADALILKIGQLNKVNVSPTSSIRRFTKQPQIDAVSAGKALNVESILEGTIQRTSDRIRITAQLVNVSDGRQIWSDKFEEKTTDFFALQDAIAVRVANSLVAQFTEAERKRMADRGTNNPEALRFYILGCIWVDKETTEGFNRSIEYLNKAIELDPNFSPAYAALSYTYTEASESHLPPNEAMPKAKLYAERALQIDDASVWANYQVAWVKMLYDWDWNGAESGFKKSQELDLTAPRPYFGYGSLLALTGRREEALAQLEKAKKINPINVIGANILYRTGEYDRAIAESKKALELNPNRITSLQWIAMSYEAKGMYEEALTYFEKARQVEDTPELKAFEARTQALIGNKDQAKTTIEELKIIAQQRYVSPFYIAVIYAGLGEKNEAFIWLEKAYQDKSWWMATLKSNPQLDDLRDDPRFQDLLRRVSLSE
ncbi:MAG: winged helix-turn-helix domain-containing protein [Pyrinomonadaceae bacterium]|nr:winged helix-turn-helix domain-containing protein [Pyrinomonadaceae bacterium]